MVPKEESTTIYIILIHISGFSFLSRTFPSSSLRLGHRSVGCSVLFLASRWRFSSYCGTLRSWLHAENSTTGWNVGAPQPIYGSQPYFGSLYLRPLVHSSLVISEALLRSSPNLTSSPAGLVAAECFTVFLIIIWQISLTALHKLFPSNWNWGFFRRLGRNLNVSEQNDKKKSIGLLDDIVLNYRLIWMRLDFFLAVASQISAVWPKIKIFPQRSSS